MKGSASLVSEVHYLSHLDVISYIHKQSVHYEHRKGTKLTFVALDSEILSNTKKKHYSKHETIIHRLIRVHQKEIYHQALGILYSPFSMNMGE